MNKSFYSIFITFFKIGSLLLGGGYVILPLLQSELVEKKEWISSDELLEYYALSQSIPGIIAANVSIFTGYKLKGQEGAVAAVLGVTLPAFLAIMLIATLLDQVTGITLIQYVFRGIEIGVIMLIFIATKQMWSNCVTDVFTCAMFIGAFIFSACFHINPALIIVIAVVVGIIHGRKRSDFLKREGDSR